MEKSLQNSQVTFRSQLENDEILLAYDRTARDLEPLFEQIAASLDEEKRRILYGYADSLKLARLRVESLAEET